MKVRISYLFLMFFMSGNLFAGFNFSHETSTVRFGDSGTAATFYLSNNITGWNGTLKEGASASIVNAGSNTIAFANGVLDDDGVRDRQTSTYEPGGTYEITLGSNQFLTGQPGEIAKSINIAGTDVKIEGQPAFSSALVFDPSATASFGLQTKLNQSIQFDAGGTNTLYLTDNLSLGDDVTIVNDGTIDLNGKTFEFGGKTLTLSNTIYWYNAGDIELHARMNLDGRWYIKKETIINGNGNVLDVTGGGYFDVDPSTTLYLTDIDIMGATDALFVMGDAGSTVRFSNVKIQLDGDISTDLGMFYVDSESTAFLHEHSWAFGGSSKLTVSCITFWKDESGQSTIGDITGNLDMINFGTIKRVATGEFVLPDWVESTSNAMNYWSNEIINNSNAIVAVDDLLRWIHGPRDYVLSSNQTLTVNTYVSNDHTISLSTSLTINGSNHEMNFAAGDPDVIDLAGNALTFESIVLNNFSPSAITTNGGSVLFGNGTIIKMADDDALLSSDYTMTFQGLAEINCYGHEFDISAMEHAMDILPGSTLVINNARIQGLGGTNGSSYINNLKCIGPDSTLVLNDSELVLEDTYSFTEGYLLFQQDVAVRGPENPAGTSLEFVYRSPQPAVIQPYAKLMFDRYTTFSYDPVTADKDLLVMPDETAILHLNHCSLFSTATGLLLTGGRLIVEDKVTVRNDATVPSEAMVLADPLEIDVLSGGILDVVGGLLEYQ